MLLTGFSHANGPGYKYVQEVHPTPSSKSKWQAIERLLERLPAVTRGRVLMWVGVASLLVSFALLAYIVGALSARLVVWLF
jgi:hypothetical protein